ncbi:hypothetical protein [Tropicibacter oceani]|uniref:Cytochrome P460 domain-containing protein n=1 Tax=Tropicibacter oceani TaxID=3058420 RepID=A0ABY8QHE1_9RHOB|nr:hypothetical protein [Tropicibacter oceani]WGW03378.1 hypothetical protein QF118_15815 [Tropicibacter oceani]
MALPLRQTALGLISTALLSLPALAQSIDDDWLSMSDAEFAAAYADMAFGDDLQQRQLVAWLWFARVNQQIAAEGKRVDIDTGTVPVWMAWATDPETFTETPAFTYAPTPRDDPQFITPKDELAGKIASTTAEGAPNAGGEEVTRNAISYDYLTGKGLNTYAGVLAHVRSGAQVDMPIGTIETKIKWVKVNARTPAPEGAMVFRFASGDYWWAGIHIMAKMRPLPADPFFSEDPSWFWTTYEFTNGLGVAHVRDAFMNQNAPIGADMVARVLEQGGIAGIGYENYSPNGTQIRFTVNADGKTPVILGHTMMEDFAGYPDHDDPSGWITDSTSCHTCHASASINPQTGNFFPFTVPVGTLSDHYIGTGTTTQDCNGFSTALGDGYVSLDFMWPIAFQTRPYACPSD